MKISEKERFMRHVEMVPEAGCWIWTGAVDRAGYGVFRLPDRNSRAHRAAYRLFVGDVPSDKMVCHRCDVPPCVNPAHLWLGTCAENMRDMLSKGRKKDRGERHYLAKLTDQQVLEIKASDLPSRALAKTYGVHQTTICDARRGYTWKHIEGAKQ